MPAPAALLNYIVTGLEATPIVLKKLLSDVDDWDKTLGPERFSLREMVAHLADWDPILIQRIERTRDEDHPFLPSVDEGQVAVDRDYANSNPVSNLERFQQGRAELVSLVKSLPADAWNRTANREFIGDVDMFQLVALILGHDAYHLKQAAESR